MCFCHCFRVAVGVSRPRRVVLGRISISLVLWSVFGAGNLAFAVVGTWSSTATTGAWQTSTNWVSGIIPGATSGTTNIDLADFNSSSSTTTIVNDAGRNLETIEFDTSAAAYTIGTTGGNSLALTANGEIFIASTFTGSNVTETINAPLTLEGNYNFANNATNPDVLLIGGAISSGMAGVQTLMVLGGGFTTIAGSIGGGTGNIFLAKNGSGTLLLDGNNTFTNGVMINSGTIELGNANALGNPSPITFVFNGATLDLGGQTVGTGPPLTVKGAGVGGNGALFNSSVFPASYAGLINGGNPSTFTIGGIGDITLSGGFNAPNTVTKVGNNTLTLSGTTDDGSLSLTVNGGTVVLAKASSPTVHAIGNPVVINSGIVQLGGTGGDQFADSANVTINASGAAFDTNGRNETLEFIALSGTGISGAGTLVNSAGGASVLTLVADIFLTTDTTIGVTQINASLTVNSQIGGNAFRGFTKVGLGTLIFTGADIDSGAVNVNSGTFMLNGGSVVGDVVNAATFVYAGTGFGGRLTNTGTAIINVDFAPGNGMENDGTASIAQGVNVTLNGAGLNNQGSLAMTGGTLTVSSSGTNVNGGSLSLTTPARLSLTGTTLTNNGMLSLDGGLVSGAGGTLVNAASGYISGTGTISSAFSNSGLLAVSSGAITVAQAFSNSGVVQLTAFNSALTGGTVTNTGGIQGLGNIGNAVTNTGTIEPIGGTLFIGGTLLNPAGGLIRVSTGNKLLVTHGLLASAGIVNLIGGTFDNNGQPMNNLGQISGFGIFATGGTGLDNNGSVTFSGGLTTVNGPLTNENAKTIVVAYNPAIFTGLVTNNGGGTFNIVSTTAVFAGGSSGSFGGTFTNNANSAFSEGGGGVLEVDGPPTLNNSSSLAVNDSSTLRFKATTGAATIGSGVTATVNNGATLELAGSVSALSNGPNRVNIIDNSTASPGILVSGTHQQVGGIDGSGVTQVNAGSDLTANHIVQSALIIGGTAGSHGLVTIDASDASGNPLGQPSGFELAGSLTPSGPLRAGSIIPADLSVIAADSTVPAVLAMKNSVGSDNPAPVPEPSTLLLSLIAVLGVVTTQFARHRFRCQTV